MKPCQIDPATPASDCSFKLLFDCAPDAMFLANLETGNIEDANLAATRLLLRPKEAIVGMHFTKLHPPGMQENSIQKFRDHILQSEVDAGLHPIEHYAQRTDGTIVPIEVVATILTIDGTKQLLGIFRDITDRHDLEKRLRENEERLNFAMEGNNDGLWDWDAVTNKVFYSKRWKEILGFLENEISDDLSEWSSRIHSDDQQAVYSALDEHLSGETSWYESEHRLKCKDGTYKWILDRGKVVLRDDNGKALRAVGTHSDITLRKVTELENQRLMKDLEQALDRVKQLTGILPICMGCKKIRDSEGLWTQLEQYLHTHSDAQFSHSFCPECFQKFYKQELEMS